MYELDEDIKEMADNLVNAIYQCYRQYFTNKKKDG